MLRYKTQHRIACPYCGEVDQLIVKMAKPWCPHTCHECQHCGSSWHTLYDNTSETHAPKGHVPCGRRCLMKEKKHADQKGK